MAKKTSYNEKSVAELHDELAKLRAQLREQAIGIMQGRNVKEYRITRKEIARVLTALSLSTNAEK